MSDDAKPYTLAEVSEETNTGMRLTPGNWIAGHKGRLRATVEALEAERAAHHETAAKALSIDRELMEEKAAHLKTREELRRRGQHDLECPSFKAIGRYGSKTGLLWAAGDGKTCTCALGEVLRG